MESLSGGGTPPEKPNKLKTWVAWVDKFLRKGQNPPPEQHEALVDNSEEVAERDKLAEIVTRKVLHDISTSGFIVTLDMGKEVRGNPYGADTLFNTYSKVGYNNSSGKRYRADLDSHRIVGGPISDELTLEVSDREDAQLRLPDQHETRQLVVNRKHDKVANTDKQETSVILNRLYTDKEEEESGNFALPISEQLQFLKELLDVSVDPQFTEEIARVAEERFGKVTWNRDNPNFSINLEAELLLPPK